ncbi:MAG: hypothetical protein ACHREM_18265 [Polyangiales bacterium]
MTAKLETTRRTAWSFREGRPLEIAAFDPCPGTRVITTLASKPARVAPRVRK